LMGRDFVDKALDADRTLRKFECDQMVSDRGVPEIIDSRASRCRGGQFHRRFAFHGDFEAHLGMGQSQLLDGAQDVRSCGLGLYS